MTVDGALHRLQAEAGDVEGFLLREVSSLLQDGRPQAALSLLLFAVRKAAPGPARAVARYCLYTFLYEVGQHARAVTLFRGLEADGDLPVAKRREAVSYQIAMLDGLARFTEAIEVVERAIDGETDPAERRRFVRHKARLLLDAGAPDEGLAILTGLLPDLPDGRERADLTTDIAWAYYLLGEGAEALRRFSAAAESRRRIGAESTMTLSPLIMLQFEQDGRVKPDLLQRLRETPEPFSMADVAMELHALSPLARAGRLPLSLLPRYRRLKTSAADLLDQDVGADLLARERLLSVLTGSGSDSEQWWSRWGDLRASSPGVPTTSALLHRVLVLLDQGRRSEASALLDEVPPALTRHISGVRDLAVAINAGERFSALLEAVIERVRELPSVTAADLRLLAEFNRDYVGRALLVNAGDRAVLDAVDQRFSDRALAGLMDGTVTVIECTALRDDLLVIRTRLVTGTAGTQVIVDPPPSGLPALGGRLQRRLSRWLPSSPGDPFDDPLWKEFAGWFRRVVPADAGHLVVIPGPLDRLPWHVAALDLDCTFSYAASWTDIVASTSGYATRVPDRLAIAAAHRAGDPADIADAFLATAGHVARRAALGGVEVSTAIGPECDRASFSRVMSDAGMALWLLHGYLDEAAAEVALMVSAGGRLPVAHAVASGNPRVRENTVNWSQLDSRTPALIVSGACSTGLSHGRGLGDRAGIYSKVRHLGTRTLIAPRWDVYFPSLEVVRGVAERVLGTGTPPALAVREATLDALESGMPPWLAAPFCVEGSWR